MLLVKTYIDRSQIHGIGIFAAEIIPSGTVVFEFGHERVFTPAEFDALPPQLQAIVLERGWQDVVDGLYRLSMDNDQFINHSDTPNISTLADGSIIANRHILVGEELTTNYREFDLRIDDKGV